MVIQQRKLVKHVWLNIELPRYTCRSCQWTESGSGASRNDSIIRKAVSKLFSILSTWDPVGIGLILELSAQSPGDSEHWFKNYFFGAGDQLQEVASRWHDPKHNWIDGQQVATPDGLALRRLFEIVDLHFPEALPEVRAVTSFVLRRQVRRRFAPTTLQLLLEKLPQLECIIYEPWRECITLKQERYDRSKDNSIDNIRTTSPVFYTTSSTLAARIPF